MIRTKTTVPLSAALLTLSTEVLAHPSHDHSHWSSPAIHAMFAAALIVAGGAGVWAYRLYRQKSQQSTKVEK